MARMRLRDRAAKVGSTYVAGRSMATIMKWKTLRRVSTSQTDERRRTIARPTMMMASQYAESISRVLASPKEACRRCCTHPRWQDSSSSCPLRGGSCIHL